MVCTFVTNDLIQEQTSVTESQLNSSLLISSELGILPAALSSLQNLERYKSDLIVVGYISFLLFVFISFWLN